MDIIARAVAAIEAEKILGKIKHVRWKEGSGKEKID